MMHAALHCRLQMMLRRFLQGISVAVLVLCTVMVLPRAFAATGIYRPINYQGKLTNTGGVAVADGQYHMRFKIFSTSTGGTALWTETWNASSQKVTATGGLFSIALGTHVTMTGSVNFNTDSLYLQVEFDPGGDGVFEEVFSPRRRFASVPYAHNADTLDGLTSTQFLRSDTDTTASGTLTVNQRTGTKLGINIISVGGTNSGAALKLSTQGAAHIVFGTGGGNYDTTLYRSAAAVLKTNGAFQVLGTLSGNIIHAEKDLTSSGTLTVAGTAKFDGGTLAVDATNNRVGIGTTGPETTLEIIGTASGQILRAQDTLASSGTLVFEGAGSGSSLYIATSLNGAGLADCDTSGSSKLLWDASTGRFSCGTDQTTSLSDGDARYVNQSGDTMTGALTIDLTSGYLGLKIIETASGNIIHAEKDLTSSGTLTVTGTGTFRKTIAVGGIAAKAYNIISDSGGAAGHTIAGQIDGDDDLFIEGALEVDGPTFLDGALTVGGTATFGSTVTLNGVSYTFPSTDASSGNVLSTNGAGQLTWRLISPINTGSVISVGDARYVNQSGDTMTGALTIDLTSGYLGLKIIETASGNIIHAEKSLTSSGTLVAVGTGSFKTAISGAKIHIMGGNSYMLGNLTIGRTSSNADLEVVGSISGTNLVIANAALFSGSLVVNQNSVFRGSISGATLHTERDITASGSIIVKNDVTVRRTISGATLTIQGNASMKVLAAGGVSPLAYNAISDAGGATSHGSDIASDDDLYIEGALEVDAATFLDSTLTVAGSGTFKAIAVGGIAAPSYNAISDAGGTTSHADDIISDDDLFIEGALEVDGPAYFDGDLTIGGSLGFNTFAVGGADAQVYNIISDSGLATHVEIDSDDDLFIEGSLEVDGAVFFDDALTVAGATTLSKFAAGGVLASAQAYNILSASATADHTLDIDASNDLYIEGALEVDGATYLDGTLSVAGNATFASTVTLNSVTYTFPSADGTANQILTTDAAGTLTWQSASTVLDILAIGDATAQDYNIISDSATATNAGFDSDNDLFIEGSLEVDGASFFDGALTVVGASTFSTIAVGGISAPAYNAIADAGASTTHGASIDADNDLYIEGALEVDGSTFLDGALTVVGTVTLNGVTYTFPAADGGADQVLSTDGAGTLSWVTRGNLSFSAAEGIYVNQSGDTMTGALTIDVTGGDTSTLGLKVVNMLSGAVLHAEKALTSSGTLSVEGLSYFRGTLSGNIIHAAAFTSSGTLSVDGNAQFKSTITISGVTYNFPDADGSASGRVLATDANGNLSWTAVSSSASNWSNTGALRGAFDARYVNQSGDTMTGALTIDLTSGSLGLKIIETASGNIIHAEKSLTSSGTLKVVGNARINGTLSGNIIHAEKDLTSSGTLKVLSTARFVGTLTGNIIHAEKSLSSSGLLLVTQSSIQGSGAFVLRQLRASTGAYFTSSGTVAPLLVLEAAGTARSPHILLGSGGVFDVSLARTAASVLSITGSLRPGKTNSYDLGSSTMRFRDLYLSGSSLHFGANANEGTLKYNTSSNYLTLGTTSQTAALNILDSNGFVGIGTTTPEATLDVLGGISGSTLRISGVTNLSGALTVVGVGKFSGYIRSNFLNNIDGSASIIGNPSNYTVIYDGAGVERIRIPSTGNIGVGTTNPGSRLSISGAVIISANGTLGAGQAQTGAALEVVGNISGSTLTVSGVSNLSGALTVNGNMTFAGLARTITVNGNPGITFSNSQANVVANFSRSDGRGHISLGNADAYSLLDNYGPFLIRTSNTATEAFYIDNSGNISMGGTTARTSSTPPVYVGASGLVGFGTTAPQTTLEIIGTASGRVLRAQDTLASSGSLVWEGAASGSTLYVATSIDGAGLTDCNTAGTSKLLWDSDTKRFSCGTDQTSASSNWSNTGSLQGAFDARYVNTSGDTMTGALTINVTGGGINTVGLKIINMASGAHLHAERLLSSSGTLVTESGAYIDGSTFVVQAGSDRVGIGTASPSQKLDVQGNIALSVNKIGGGLDYGYLGAGGAGTILLYSASDGSMQFDTTYSGGYFDFQRSGVSKLRIDSDGEVGIGTTTPGSRLSVSGAVIISANGNLEGAGAQAGVALEIIGTASGRVLRAQDTLASSGSLVWEGAASGSTLYVATSINGAGLTDCDTAGTSKLLWDASTGRFSCGTDQGGEGSGISQSAADARYINQSGDTMTGALTINVTGGGINTVGLKIINMASGAHLHAESLLSSSGTLVTESGAYIDGSTFVVQAGSNNVGIGDSTPDFPLDVTGKIRSTSHVIASNFLYLDGLGTSAYIAYVGGDFSTDRGFNLNGQHLLATTGEVVFNDTAANLDFRVEGDTNANLLFLDASTDRIGIGTSSPETTLEIIGTASGNTLHAEKDLTSSGTLKVLSTARFVGTLTGNILHAEKSLSSSGLLLVTQSSIQGSGAFVLRQLRASTGAYLTSSGTTAPLLVLEAAGTARSPHILLGSGGVFDVSLARTAASVLSITGSLRPGKTNSYDLGSSTMRFRDLYLSGSSLHFGANANEGTLKYNTSSNYLTLGTTSQTAALNILDSNGFVGIGTTTPETKLDVLGALSGSRIIISGNASVSGALVVKRNARVQGTLSGNIIHAEKDLTSSGGLKVLGAVYIGSHDSAGLAYNIISNSATSTHGFSASNELFIEGALEVDAASFFDAALTVGTTLDVGGLATLESLAVTNASNLSTLNTSGLATVESLTVTNAATLSSTLGVTGVGTFNASILIDSESATGTDDLFKIVSDVAADEDTAFRIQANGEVYSDGVYSSAGADYAEWFFSARTPDLKPGELVCIDPLHDNAVQRCTRESDPNLMGIVSTHPAFIGNVIGGASGLKVPGYILVGLIGQVPAHVSTANGPIRPGDALTSSDTPGVARRANAGDSTVGVALEGYDGTEQGIVNVLISRRNSSLTVDAVGQKVLDTIAAMEIDDEVQLLVQQSIEKIDFKREVVATVDQQIAALDLAGQVNQLVAAHLGSGSTVADRTLVTTVIEEVIAFLRTTTGAVVSEEHIAGLVEQRLGIVRGSGSILLPNFSVEEAYFSELTAFSGATIGGTLHATALEVQSGAVIRGGMTLHGQLTPGENFALGSLRFSGSIVSIGNLTATGSLQVIGEITISGLATFLGPVHVQGELIVSNRQAGYATIPASGTSVTIHFDPPMAGQPIVTASPDVPVLYGVSKATTGSVTIRLAAPATEQVTFSYVALTTVDPNTATGSLYAAAPVPFLIDAQHRPFSDNDPIWTACIQKTVLLSPDGTPYNCSRYHDANVWQHPDLNIQFTYNDDLDPPVILLPEGYQIVVDEQRGVAEAEPAVTVEESTPDDTTTSTGAISADEVLSDASGAVVVLPAASGTVLPAPQGASGSLEQVETTLQEQAEETSIPAEEVPVTAVPVPSDAEQSTLIQLDETGTVNVLPSEEATSPETTTSPSIESEPTTE